MINKTNYFSKVESINYKNLPEALKEGYDTIKFGSKDYTTWEYLNDDEEFLKMYFEKLNAFLDKENIGSKKAVKPEKKTTKTSQPKTEKPKAEKSNEKKVVKAKSKKTTVTKKANKATKPVELVHAENRFIKRYILLNGQVKTKNQILVFINSLQKAITEKRIRKTSSYASEIMHIQEQLIKLFDSMPEQVKVEIDEATIEKYKNIATEEKTMLSISYIKRYIRLHGKTDVKEKAKLLFQQLKSAAEKKNLTKDDPYKAKLEFIYNSLNDYIAGKSKVLKIQQAELNGLLGLAGIKQSSKKKVSPKPTKIIRQKPTKIIRLK